MNKKGFTLVELIAVVVIMAIIAMIATPNIISMMNNGKREDFINNANEIMSKAVYMYKLDKYKNDSNIFENGNRIKLKNIEDINTLEDPFGGEYDLENSYVIIESVNNGTIVEIPKFIINPANKNMIDFPNDIQKKIEKREKVVLFGDTPGDIRMIENKDKEK